MEQIEGMLFEQRCKVCGLGETYVEMPCPADCGANLHIKAEYGSLRTCQKCDYDVTANDMADVLDTQNYDPSDFRTPINCGACISTRVRTHSQ